MFVICVFFDLVEKYLWQSNGSYNNIDTLFNVKIRILMFIIIFSPR